VLRYQLVALSFVVLDDGAYPRMAFPLRFQLIFLLLSDGGGVSPFGALRACGFRAGSLVAPLVLW
jgi:hypothetical protein